MTNRQKTVVNRLLTLALVVLLRMSLAAQERTNHVPTCNNNPLAMFIITNLLAEPQPAVSVPLFSFTNVGPEGNYWRIQGPDLPLPFDPFVELPAYQIGTNQFLIDDRSVDYPVLNALLEAEAEADGWTNNPPTTISLMDTNGLWINVPTNSLDTPGYLTANLMNTLQGQSYDVLTSAGLPASWATELTVTGAVGNLTPVQLPMNGRTNLFLEARTSPDYSFYLVTQPLSQEVCDGDTVTFSVATGGNTNLSFQWTLNGVAIPGATNSSYSDSGFLYPAEGYYACIISDGTNSLTTAAGQLTTAWVSNDLGLMYLVGNRQDYTFKSGVTYYIGWPIQLYGNTTIEAGAVLKFDWNYSATLQIMGTLTCKGEPYYPAMLTSVDDDSVGEGLLDPFTQLPFSAEDGPPQPYSTGVPYLDMTYATSNSISNLRFSYADWGVTTPVLSGTLDVWDSQFVQCNFGVVNLVAAAGAADNLHNVLFSQCAAAVAASTNAIHVTAEQVTAQVSNFCLAAATPSGVALTNSIIWGSTVAASNLLTVSVVFNPDPTNFQPTGAGNYYLAPASPLHNAGTANISPRLQNELQAKTTYPPVVIATFTTNSGAMTFSPQAPRYAGGAPDLGWYYDALDYTVDDMTLNGGSLTVLPGTAVGYRFDAEAQGVGWNAMGFDVREDSSLISQGTPNHPNVFVDAQLVQEQFAWPILAGIVPDFFPTYPNSQPPVLSFRFTKFRLNYYPWYGNSPMPAFHFWSGVEPINLSAWSYDSAMYLTLQDCDLRGGQISLAQPDHWTYDASSFWGTGAVGWTNNSFDNVAINLDPGYPGYTNVDLAFSAYNNLFRGGQWLHLRPVPTSAGNWVFKDNLFDQADIFQDTGEPLSFGNNGYWPLSANSLQWYFWLCPPLGVTPATPYNSATLQPGGGASPDVTLNSPPPYQPGPLGRFYLPTSTALFGAGSRSAADASLFHYTTRLDQLKEGEESSGHMANIGLHYVATTNSGSFLPRDADADGVPDYLENANGSGIYNPAAESDWRTPETNGVYFLGLTNGMVLSGVVNFPVELYGVSTDQVASTAFYTDVQPVIGAAAQNSHNLWLNWRMKWDTRMVTNGTYTVFPEADFVLDDPAEGVAISVTISNEISFPNWMPGFGELGNSLAIAATSAHTNADWSIDIYDSQNSYVGSLSGHADDGNIEAVWNLAGPGGELRTNDNFFTFVVTTVFNSGSPSGGSAQATALTPPLYKVTDPWLGPGAWVAVVQHAWDSTRGADQLYSEIDGFIGAAQGVGWTVMPPPQGQDAGGNPLAYGLAFGAQNRQGDIDWQAFRDALYNPLSRNLVYVGHGTPDGLGYNPGSINRYISATEIGNRLHTIPAGQANRHAFRFVLADGCSTASGTLPEAFGVIHREIFDLDYYTAASLRPSAFAGWTAPKWISLFNGAYINTSHVNFILHIQTQMLLQGYGLQTGITTAAWEPDVFWAFAWWNQMGVYGFFDLHFGQFNN